MRIFDFEDYKAFFTAKLKAMPKKGHGQLLKISKILGVHTTMLTHILRGKANFSMEQALKVAHYLGLDAVETDFFMNLVQLERAGDTDTKSYYRKQLAQIRAKASNLRSRLEVKKALDEADQAKFYSDWAYSGVRLLTALPEFQAPHAIAEYFRLPVAEVHRILQFLVSVGLCTEIDGKFQVGITQTYIGRESPLLPRHLANWRLRVMEQFKDIQEEELVYTNPVVVSAADFARIREKLVELLKDFRKIYEPSLCEELACLNIDWVKIR